MLVAVAGSQCGFVGDGPEARICFGGGCHGWRRVEAGRTLLRTAGLSVLSLSFRKSSGRDGFVCESCRELRPRCGTDDETGSKRNATAGARVHVSEGLHAAGHRLQSLCTSPISHDTLILSETQLLPSTDAHFTSCGKRSERNTTLNFHRASSFLRQTGRVHGPSTLALRASQCFVAGSWLYE